MSKLIKYIQNQDLSITKDAVRKRNQRLNPVIHEIGSRGSTICNRAVMDLLTSINRKAVTCKICLRMAIRYDCEVNND